MGIVCWREKIVPPMLIGMSDPVRHPAASLPVGIGLRQSGICACVVFGASVDLGFVSDAGRVMVRW